MGFLFEIRKMITKQEVTNKLDALLAYSVEQKPDFESYYNSLMQPCYDAVNAYFSASRDNFKKPTEEYIFQAYCDINNRNQVWEKPVDYNFPTNYPTGYNDFRDCFYSFNDILNITNETFFNAWIEDVPETETMSDSTDPVPQPVPIANPYLTAWTADITEAPTKELNKINACVEWLKTCSDGKILIDLLEDQGTLVESMEQQEIANVIYKSRHVLEVLNERNISVYVPTYMGLD